MSHVRPVEAPPVRPTTSTQTSVRDGRGRARCERTGVSGVIGMGEIHGSEYVLPVDGAADEVVEVEEEAQPISTLPSPA